MSAIDAALLAREPVPKAGVPCVRAAVDPVGRSATVAIGGTF